MNIHDVNSANVENDMIWFGKEDVYVIEKKKSRVRKSVSKNVMSKLKQYILENAKELPNKHIIFQHKLRMEYMKFNNGILYIQAHLKRNIIGMPKYWQMGFYFEGNKCRLSYEEYVNVKISEIMGFRYIYEKKKRVEELYEQLNNGMAILAGEFIEYLNININDYRKRYIIEYEKLMKKSKKRKCNIIRINDE